MSHPHRMSVPSSPGIPLSPGIPPSLYSGMSSLQINQAGPGSVAGSSYYPPQSQKALLKGPKTTRHQSRKNEHPSSSAPWRDPREAAAASAGRKRSLKDDASFRQGQTMWTPFPPDARPTSREEATVTMRAVVDRLKEEEARARFVAETDAKLASMSEMIMHNGQQQRELSNKILQDHRDLTPIMLNVLRMCPDEESRQKSQNLLNLHYKDIRDMESRRATRELERQRDGFSQLYGA